MALHLAVPVLKYSMRRNEDIKYHQMTYTYCLLALYSLGNIQNGYTHALFCLVLQTPVNCKYCLIGSLLQWKCLLQNPERQTYFHGVVNRTLKNLSLILFYVRIKGSGY